MAELFLMPKLGMDMEEGTVVRWLKAAGEAVKQGEALAEIETDKATVEVESPAAGVVLRRYQEEGTAVPCGTPLAAIGQPGKLRATPRARRLAEKEQVDLYAVTGTGPHGRIVEQDVRDYRARAGSAPAVRRRVPQETVTPLAGVRKITANRMHQSLSEMAQTDIRVDVDMTNMISLRRQLNARWEAEGRKVSFVDLLAAVCAKALLRNPQANASLLPDGVHTRNYAHIGVAVDTERGLVAPVIRDADALSLAELSDRSRALIDRARRGALQPDEMKGGTFTISNLGMFEIDSFTAIVNPPETCILAVGRIADKPAVVDGQLTVRPLMNLCLSYDHRVLDGAPAARFLQDIKRHIENPVWVLL